MPALSVWCGAPALLISMKAGSLMSQKRSKSPVQARLPTLSPAGKASTAQCHSPHPESLLHKDSGLTREPSPWRSESKGQYVRSADSAYPAQSARFTRSLLRTASSSRQFPAPWLKLDKFLLSLLTEDYEVTAGPPSTPSKAIHTKDFNPLQRGLAPP